MTEPSRSGESLSGKLVAHTVTPVLTALMLPTAQAVGEGLASIVRRKFEEWDQARRDANLKVHLERNKPKLEDAALRPPAADSIKLIGKWVEAVEDVSADDAELSAAWDNVLASILDDDPLASVLVETLRSLSRAEVVELLRFRSGPSYRLPRGTLHDEVLQRLALKGVVRIHSLWLAYIGFAVLMIAASSIYEILRPANAPAVGGYVAETTARIGGDLLSRMILPTGVSLFVLAIGAGHYLAGYTYRIYFLTRFGRRLVATAPKAR